jgi:hypothetical protein
MCNVQSNRRSTGRAFTFPDHTLHIAHPLTFPDYTLHIELSLPGRLQHAWNFATQRQSAEAQAADAELAQVRARASAQLATVVLARGELRLLVRLGYM